MAELKGNFISQFLGEVSGICFYYWQVYKNPPNGRVKVVYACDRNKQPPSSSAERVRRTVPRQYQNQSAVLEGKRASAKI
ncbi:Uncharacterized protein HZ326_18288 [Fusarium oxysporum f. sp. albedinis]|nr:Uncharacterized protein HZ326_18288 [Fusarium oxysporum f. sp. albedinis]